MGAQSLYVLSGRGSKCGDRQIIKDIALSLIFFIIRSLSHLALPLLANPSPVLRRRGRPAHDGRGRAFFGVCARSHVDRCSFGNGSVELCQHKDVDFGRDAGGLYPHRMLSRKRYGMAARHHMLSRKRHGTAADTTCSLGSGTVWLLDTTCSLGSGTVQPPTPHALSEAALVELCRQPRLR